MGLFLCEVCNESLGIESINHTCYPQKIKEYVKRLQQESQEARIRLDDIQNAVFKILQPLPSLEQQYVTVETEYLRRLWDAANCQWAEQKSADSFLVCWLVTHHILSEAFDLFRSKANRRGEVGSLNKLKVLKDACEEAKKVLGYSESSDFDLSPEEVLKR